MCGGENVVMLEICIPNCCLGAVQLRWMSSEGLFLRFLDSGLAWASRHTAQAPSPRISVDRSGEGQ